MKWKLTDFFLNSFYIWAVSYFKCILLHTFYKFSWQNKKKNLKNSIANISFFCTASLSRFFVIWRLFKIYPWSASVRNILWNLTENMQVPLLLSKENWIFFKQEFCPETARLFIDVCLILGALGQYLHVYNVHSTVFGKGTVKGTVAESWCKGREARKGKEYGRFILIRKKC